MLALPGVGKLARHLPRWRGVLTLNYHRVGDSAGQPWDRTLWSTNADTLDAQLGVLARHAEVVTPEEVPRLVRDNRPGRRVLLTFDDGYRDNFKVAFPLLRKHGLCATFFLASGFLDHPRAAWWDELAWMVRRATRTKMSAGEWLPGSLALGPEQDATIATIVAHYKTLPSDDTERYLEYVASATGAGRCDRTASADLWMTWEMARELRSAGMQIGGHTVTHPILARVPQAQQEEEIAGCKLRLQEELGQEMDWFAYPVGAQDTFTDDTRRILRDHGVQLAFSFYGGFGHFTEWDSLDVPRVHVGPDHGPELLQAMVWLPRLFARW
ncbi:MAG TPA: polysaccharide deacetylase family protein [Solirubrobacteraceae bacterium]